MLQLINHLCREEFELSDSSLRKLTALAGQSTSDLLSYKHEKTGDTLMNHLARSGQLNLIKLLFTTGFDRLNRPMIDLHMARKHLFIANNDSKNALHESCQFSHFECVKFLVETIQMPINSLRRGDWTPLMLACTRDNLEIIRYLVQNGADTNQKNKDGWNAFQIAIREGHLDIIEYFLDLDPTFAFAVKTKNQRTPFHTTCLHGHLSVLKMMIQKTTDHSKVPIKEILNAKDSCGITPFMDSVLGNRLDVVKYFMENQLSDLYERDQIGNSCIHLAAQSDSLNTLKYLFWIYFKTKSNLFDDFSNNLNRFSMTPLHSACKNGKSDVIEYFLNEFKSDKKLLSDLINKKDSNNHSSIDICVASNNQTCVNILNKFLIIDD